MAKYNRKKKQSNFTIQFMERLAYEIQLRRYRRLSLGLMTVSIVAVIVFAAINRADHVVKLALHPSQLSNHWGMFISTLISTLSIYGLLALGLSICGFVGLTKIETIQHFIRKTNISQKGVSNMRIKALGGIKTLVIGGSAVILTLSVGAVYAQMSPNTPAAIQAKQKVLTASINKPAGAIISKSNKPSICPTINSPLGCRGCSTTNLLCKPPCLLPIAQNVTHLDCGPFQPPSGIIVPPCLTPIPVVTDGSSTSKTDCGPSQPPTGGGGGGGIPNCYGAVPMTYPVPPNYNCGPSTPPGGNTVPPCVQLQPVPVSSESPSTNCGPVPTGTSTGGTASGSTSTGPVKSN